MSTNAVAEYDTRLFGHPRGLLVLFFTELLERFSYYGMRAILILYLVASVEEGGLGFNVAKAGARDSSSRCGALKIGYHHHQIGYRPI